MVPKSWSEVETIVAPTWPSLLLGISWNVWVAQLSFVDSQ
jgi:hypothetical protein